MDAPPSPNHVFNFPEAEFEEDPQEGPKEEVEEDPKEDPEEGPEEDTVEDPEEGPEEDPEAEAENNVPPLATPPVGSPITPSSLSESSSDTEDDALVIENEALEMSPVGSTYEVGGPSFVTPFPLFYLHGSEIASSEIREGKKRMDKMEQGLGDEMQFSNRVEHRVTDLENREQERDEEMIKALVFERLGWGAWDARPDVGNDRPVSFGEPKPPKLPGSPSRRQPLVEVVVAATVAAAATTMVAGVSGGCGGEAALVGMVMYGGWWCWRFGGGGCRGVVAGWWVWCRSGDSGGEGGAWGEWRGGSDRSGYGESFWVRRKKPAGKVFRRRRGGRRWMRPPNSHDIHKMNIGLPQLTRLLLYGSASLSKSCK
nr:hypothetical protein [Tanacetum cinerariifolium]